MPKKTVKKTVEKVEKQVLYPPKPPEKLTPGQILYPWNPVDGYRKMVFEKSGKSEGEIVCRAENGQGWILNIEHLHKTILTEEEYEKLGQMDKDLSRLP